jgi:peptide/nickel transport system permease protein
MTTLAEAPLQKVRRVGGLPRLRRELRLVLPCLWVALIILAAVFAAQLSPHDFRRADVSRALEGPTWLSGAYHLGTDQLGRDVLSRLLYGARTSLLVGVGSVLISLLVGVPLGLLAGYAGSFVDMAIMRVVDFQMSIPPILLLVMLATLIGPGLLTTIVILGVAGWVRFARMARAETKVVQGQAYVLSARSTGCSPLRIVLRHVLPNVASSIFVLATLQFGQSIILEASISFLGFGVRPPASSLGLMVSDGRNYLNLAWWLLCFPAAVLFIMVLSANVLGDDLGGRLDPVRRRW